MSRDPHDAIIEARELRKKLNRIEKSRGAIKSKSREKARAIKAHQDREQELKENRDEWKAKCKEQEKEAEKLRSDLRDLAKQLHLTESIDSVRY